MTRFWRVALLTLLIALLPLRGWAWAVMPMPVPDHDARIASGQATPHALHSAHAPAAASFEQAAEHSAPCHGPQASVDPDQGSAGHTPTPTHTHPHLLPVRPLPRRCHVATKLGLVSRCATGFAAQLGREHAPRPRRHRRPVPATPSLISP